MHDISSFKRDLLVVVAGMDGPEGTEIRRELEEYYPEEITAGRVYPQLTELADKGLINKQIQGRANKYWLTERGVKELQQRREWEETYLAPIEELSKW